MIHSKKKSLTKERDVSLKGTHFPVGGLLFCKVSVCARRSGHVRTWYLETNMMRYRTALLKALTKIKAQTLKNWTKVRPHFRCAMWG